MAVDIHMTFQGAGTQPVTLEVETASFSGEQALNIGSQSTGAGAGKVTFNPFTFTKKSDVNSVDFWNRLCTGSTFQKVSLDVTKAGGGATTPQSCMSFTMGLVAVKSITFSLDDGDESPKETITLEYGQISYTASMNADGTAAKPLAAAWNLLKNTVLDPTKIGTVI